jgi:ribosomal subunit interface protein
MNLTVSGHHLDVTQAIRDHVEDKLLPIQRHEQQITRIEVTLIVESINIKLSDLHLAGADLFASPIRRYVSASTRSG